jgi:extracellular sulfatase Sulf
LLSVDDYLHAIFDTLEAAGGEVLNNTYVIATSDHGYHLGSFKVPFEKSLVYETDVKVPFFVRGPSVPDYHTETDRGTHGRRTHHSGAGGR